jgi:hypothetical protein
MVKRVKRFEAELQGLAFALQLYIFGQRHIEVQAAGITEEVAARIPVG